MTCSPSTPIRVARAARPTVRWMPLSSARTAGSTPRSTPWRPAGPCSSSPTRETLPADAVYRRELTVVGSRSATPESMHAAAALLPALDVPAPLVLPLERFDEGLDLFMRRAALKVVFVP